MKARQIQEEIERLHYWDARVLQITAEYFGDEVTIIFQDADNNIKLLFSGCSKVNFTTDVSDRKKPLRKLTIPQIPYFIQDIEVVDCIIDEFEVLNCKILMPPMSVEVSCNQIIISKV
ncbi:hypothetical protein [Pelosinus sp. UFO1]|uniref:hypothetical protein n=1 Tax=Pelosinus sp. UFO1 TaxID=484770 RepID=UPI0004D1874E|nr:hypothetical protein [Pelosinus sp. UFO1]AIF51845.1 hypothetical protein UFO1_2298 [Pelosinus sp. UFO1]